MRKFHFTLIELILLLVVLGIIFGVFLSFGDKVQLSEVQAIISSVRKYDVATDSFLEKYGELPGDLKKTQILGITQNNTDGNQNGILEDLDGVTFRRKNSIRKASGEITNFWLHLSKSGFLNDRFDGRADGSARLDFTIPRVGNSHYGITVFGYKNQNYYQVGFVGASKTNILMSDKSLKTSIAFNVDKKTDDGSPREGNIVAVSGAKFVNGYKNVKANCVDANGYNLKHKGRACQLRIKMLQR